MIREVMMGDQRHVTGINPFSFPEDQNKVNESELTSLCLHEAVHTVYVFHY